MGYACDLQAYFFAVKHKIRYEEEFFCNNFSGGFCFYNGGGYMRARA